MYVLYSVMVWSDWGVEDKLEVARLDGADRRVLVNSGLNKPRGIAIDYKTERWVMNIVNVSKSRQSGIK